MPRRSGPRRPTSADVARLAGVSRTTVSFVLNDAPNASISAETRARVHEAVAKLDYYPDEAARSLRSRMARSLAVALPDAHNPHYMEIFSGIEAYARRNGYAVFVSITGADLAEEQRCFEWLKQKRNDALILASSADRLLHDEIRALGRRGYIVTTLANVPNAAGDSVISTPGRAERLVLEHLHGLGHRRIGYIFGVSNHELLAQRLTMCLQIQQELGLPIVERWIRRCGPTPADGYQAAGDLLASLAAPERPTALIVVNDLLATAVLAALFARQIRVPDELSVVSFDNTSLASYAVPPLTSIDLHAREMGMQATRLTIERIAQPGRAPACIEIAADLMVRQSSAPPPETQGWWLPS